MKSFEGKNAIIATQTIVLSLLFVTFETFFVTLQLIYVNLSQFGI